jgi:hypothetical protein
MATRRQRNDDGELQCKECEKWLPELKFTTKKCNRSGYLYPHRTCKKCVADQTRARRQVMQERNTPSSVVSEFMRRTWV